MYITFSKSVSPQTFQQYSVKDQKIVKSRKIVSGIQKYQIFYRKIAIFDPKIPNIKIDHLKVKPSPKRQSLNYQMDVI